MDEHAAIRWINQSFCDFLGVERERLIGKKSASVSEPCLIQVLNHNNRIELFAGILNKWIELKEVIKLDGSLVDDEPVEKLTICYYEDASEKVKLEQHLKQLESTISHKMSHDPVTGMLNHHSMLQTLSAEVSRSRRYDNPLSIILMKVDYSVLSQGAEAIDSETVERYRLVISQLLKDQMRWADIVGHIEHYDFVLLLPETDYDSAKVLLNKLNQGLKNAAIDIQAITYGVSQWRKGDDVNLFFARAAENMNPVSS
jgi:GGDEF domain-containing protein